MSKTINKKGRYILTIFLTYYFEKFDRLKHFKFKRIILLNEYRDIFSVLKMIKNL